MVERENAFFKSSPVDEYHLPQMHSEKGCMEVLKFHFQILKFRKFGVGFSGKEIISFTSLQYVESLLAHQVFSTPTYK
jgi:hypothetical protein